MDLHQLRIFVAIADKGNITRASESLYLSQPAVSAQIKSLEDELGIKLFHRASRGMELTPAGSALLTEASDALSAAQKIVQRARNLRTDVVGEFKLGTVSEPLILRLGEFLTTLRLCHPGLSISLSQGISGEIIEQLLSRKIHGGYVIGAVADDRFATLDVFPVTLRVVGPPAWRDELLNADWATMANFPWISTPAKCSFKLIADNMFKTRGLRPRTVIEADQEVTLKKLVSSNIGLTLMREDAALLAEQMGELVIWPHCQEPSTLYFVYLKAEEETPAMQAVLGAVKAVWRLPA